MTGEGISTYSCSRDAQRRSRPLRQLVRCFQFSQQSFSFQLTSVVANVATLVARTTGQHHFRFSTPIVSSNPLAENDPGPSASSPASS